MRIEQENIRCRVLEATDQERAWLRSYLTFTPKRVEAIGGEGHHLFNEFGGTFATGLLPLVVSGFAKAGNGGTLDIVDARAAPCTRDDGADLAWLRDYQRKALDACVARTRGIVRCPTGSGKTEIAVGLVQSLPCRWLFLVHRGGLLNQTVERYRMRTNQSCGQVGDGGWEGLDERFVVATFQTVYAGLRAEKGSFERRRAISLLMEAQGLIVDECHVLPAWTFYRAGSLAKHAYYRIGLSGTPLNRTDERSYLAVAQLGPVVFTLPPDELMEAGVLARPIIRMVTCWQRHACTDWPTVNRELVVHSDARNAVVLDCARHAAKPGLLFVRDIKHGRQLLEGLERRHMRAEFVWGKDSTDRRLAAVDRLVRGELDMLVCSVVFQEGIDIPTLRSVVLAGGGKSWIATLQQIGRGMRCSEGKTTFEVWDVADRGNKWLQRHTAERYRAYRSESYNVDILASSEASQESLFGPGYTVPKTAQRERDLARARLEKHADEDGFG